MDLSWYNSINKPIFTPPSWLFAPVWIILYLLMAVSAYLIWKKGFKKPKVKNALKIFSIQLILNLIWTPVFFGAHQIGLSFLIIVLLLVFIYKTIKAFEKIDKLASYLLLPYILWVSFATLLNFSIWLVN